MDHAAIRRYDPEAVCGNVSGFVRLRVRNPLRQLDAVMMTKRSGKG